MRRSLRSRPRKSRPTTALLGILLAACAGTAVQRATEEANRLLREGRTEEALAAYREGLRHSPDVADLHYGEALALYAFKRFDEAETPLRRAVGLDGRQAEYHLYLGHVLGRLERMEEAVEAYRESTRLAPIAPDGWKGLGLAEYNLGRWAEARVALEKYLAYAPAARDRPAISGLVRSLPRAPAPE